MTDVIAYASLVKRVYDQGFEGMRTRFSLSQSEADVLMFLHNNPECNTAREVEALRGLSKSVVSAALDQLCRRGYVLRREDAGDRRVVRLALTAAAGEAAEAGTLAQQGVMKRLLAGFSPEERARLDGYFQRIRFNISMSAKDDTERT